MTICGIKDLHSNLEFRRALDRLSKAQESWGILIVGLDGFRRINNLYSYSFGDKVLERFAVQAGAVLAQEVGFYKLDGDCFGLLCPNASQQGLLDYFQAMQQIAQSSIEVEHTPISLTLSGGICFAPQDGAEGEQLYTNARIALMDSKEQGGGRVTVLSSEMLSKVQFSLSLLEAIKQSVQNHFEGFSLCYQPLVLAQTGELYGCEVLLRWRHAAFPKGVSPYEFIPILENYGMMVEVGSWVFEQAVAQLAQWVEVMPTLQMSINVSSLQFEQPNFKLFVMDTLHRYKVNPNLITLELTESGQIANVENVGEIFNFLRSQNIKIAFDDFGMGYASLEIFRVLSADELKIDRSFLDRISYDVTDQKIVSQIIQLCDSMNMFVCVEGVETKEMESIVKQLKPRLLQGYYYSQPIDAAHFYESYLRRQELAPAGSAVEAEESSLVYASYKPDKPMELGEIIDNAHAGIFQVGMDHEFTFLTCNEGYRRMLGYTATEIDQKFRNRALGFVHPEDVEYVGAEIARQLGQGDTITIEFRVVRADGTPLWILGTGNVVKGKNGSMSLVVIIIENNHLKTESLRIERENAIHQRILSRIPTGIKYLHFDKDFTIEYISDGLLSILGYTRQEIGTLFDHQYINLIYEEDREKVLNDVVEQLKLSNVLVLHYRSICKDGSLVWLETVSCLYGADSDGIQRCCSSVVNVTQTITEEKKQRAISLATRYQHAATTLWGDILFEYHFETQKISCSENFQTVFGRAAFEHLDDALHMVHSEDRATLLRAIEEMCHSADATATTFELRLRQADGEYVWCAVACNQPDHIGGIPISVIGKLYKIDDELKKQQKLLEKVQIDPLTGLLNKSTLESRASQQMGKRTGANQFALFAVDIDDFQQLNDTHGHMMGDEVLQVLAKRLQSIFKSRDLVARTGGDEFMVFAHFYHEEQFIEAKCKRILRTLKEPIKLGEKMLQVKVSLGVTFTQKTPSSFYELYQQANAALYRAKKLGKNRYGIL